MTKNEETITGEVLPYDRIELAQVLDALTGKGRITLLDEDPEVVTRRIVARILEAETMDEVFASQAVQKADDLLNVPLRLLKVDWIASDFEEGPGVFALATVALLSTTFCGEFGEIVKVSLGGQQIVAQLYKWANDGGEARSIVIRKKDTPTKAGYYPKWLESAPISTAA
jgi:hypothetical protein